MQIEELAAKVEQLGLSAKQAKVLVAGMMLGPAPASKIAEQAGISRPSAYDILAELEELGLAVRSSRDALTLFAVADAAGIAEWIERQRATVDARERALAQLSDDLGALTRQAPEHQPRVRFVQGSAGIKAILDEAQRKAAPGSTVYALTNHDETWVRYPEHSAVNAQRRVNKKLKSRQFYFNSREEVPSNPELLKETIRLTSPSKGDLTLYDDRAVLLSYEGGWAGVVIESPAIVAVLRQLFELAWENQKTVEKV